MYTIQCTCVCTLCTTNLHVVNVVMFTNSGTTHVALQGHELKVVSGH